MILHSLIICFLPRNGCWGFKMDPGMEWGALGSCAVWFKPSRSGVLRAEWTARLHCSFSGISILPAWHKKIFLSLPLARRLYWESSRWIYFLFLFFLSLLFFPGTVSALVVWGFLGPSGKPAGGPPQTWDLWEAETTGERTLKPTSFACCEEEIKARKVPLYFAEEVVWTPVPPVSWDKEGSHHLHLPVTWAGAGLG